MSPAVRGRLLGARELIVLELVDSVLTAAELELELEHPTIAEPPFRNAPPTLRRARALVRLARRLREELALYRRDVDAALAEPDFDDIPF